MPLGGGGDIKMGREKRRKTVQETGRKTRDKGNILVVERVK
jgi:hypothetical protein